jgi:hypothetical protein
VSSSFDHARGDFGRALRALQPYADDLVVIGGMAPILYRLVRGVAEAVVDPIATKEVDGAHRRSFRRARTSSASSWLRKA